jgi:hypothetical protein
VQVTIDHIEGRLERFDASIYFQRKNIEVANKVELTEKEATSYLPPTVEIAGEIKQEINSGKSRGNQIVYTTPVKGIDRVKEVYINSENGKIEGYEYEQN